MKRKISLFLAAIMTVTSMAIASVTSSAATETPTFSDVTSETKYSEAILTLAKLGVVNGNEGKFNPEAGITRAEVVAIITRAMNIADYATGASPFTDVPEGFWGLKNIIAATSRGIVNGYGDGLFGPQDNVTYEQVMKMLVCAMNYGNAAEALGGWPNGYFNKATDLGLTAGIDASVLRNAPAPRGVVAQAMFNALDIKVADPKTSIATDETFLNEFLGMDMVTGTLVGVEEDVTADCDEELARDEMAVLPKNDDLIRIDFEGVAEADTLVKSLGKEVLVVYKIAPAGGMNTLVILDTEVTENEETEITYDNIISYKNGNIEYYNESGRKKSIDFDVDEVTVYYNKKAVDSRVDDKLDEWLDPNSEEDFIYGTVTLVDSGSDGKIDMVEILDYEYMVALRAPSSNDYKVSNKMKFKNKDNAERILDEVVLNPDKNSYSFKITDQNGVKLETTGIKANNVVMVATSEDEDYYTVLVSTKTVDGEINAFSTTDNTIQIGGKEYTITNDCISYLEEQGSEIKNGAKGKFYLDGFGNIAYATLNVSTESTTTVYLITAIYDEDTEDGSLRVFVPGSGYKTYPLDDKVKLDGKTTIPEDAIYYLRDNSENFIGKAYGIEKESNANQLIKIELSGNTVKEIYTIDATETGTTSETAGLKMYLDEPMKFKYNANTFTSTDGDVKFFTNSSTKFIYVPKDRTETKSYQKKTASYFEKTVSYTIEPFNVNDSKMAEVVIIYGAGDTNKVSGSTAISIVAAEPGNKVSNDEVLKELSYYTNNDTLVKKVVDEDEDVDDLVAGDVFRFAATNEGYVGDVRVKISYEDILDVLKDGEYDWNASKFSFETSYKRQDGSGLPYVTAAVYNVAAIDDGGEGIIVTKDGFVDGVLPEDADTILIPINDSTKILKMSEDGDKILAVDEESDEPLTIDDILTAEYDDDKCSKVVVTTQANEYARLIIIYE